MSLSLDPSLRDLNACGCCEGLTVETPVALENRPGLSAIAYRIGTHSRFKNSLLARLSAAEIPALRDLKTRDNQDFTIALLDAWATVADVLSFYQERIANEAYLRTATERESLVRLSRLVGYEPRSGVAASVHLAFTLETGSGLVQNVPISAGTRIQSIPGPGERPQTFETVEAIEARPEWNAMRPRLSQPPPPFNAQTQTLTVQGVNTNLKPGDSLLLVAGSGVGDRWVRKIVRVTLNAVAQTTQIDLVADPPDPPPLVWSYLPLAPFIITSYVLTNQNVKNQVLKGSWRQADLSAFTRVQQWSMRALMLNIKAQVEKRIFPVETGVFAFRTRSAIFGHNAPKWASLTAAQQTGENNWDSPQRKLSNDATPTGREIHLETTVPSIIPGSWVVLESPNYQAIYCVKDNAELSRSAYTLSSKVTRLRLDSYQGFSDLTVRETTVLAQSEKLTLADRSVTTPIDGERIVLDGVYLDLSVGRPVVVKGQREDLDGVEDSEVVYLAEVIFNQGYTEVVFKTSLVHSYRRETVTLNANVALATHGEKKEEAIGSGDANRPFQRFALRHPPLTYVSAANPVGALSTLEIRVDGLLWNEVPSFYGHGPQETIYITRTDDTGQTFVQFGDGRTGKRLPTGQENVRATYRQGMGEEGLVKAGQLSLLMTRPLGVQGVENPLAARDAADRESPQDIRQNASLNIRTLNRIVSLRDYEDFARAFNGIAKAMATWMPQGQRRGIFLTVAGAKGQAILPGGTIYTNLLAAIKQAGDPLIGVTVQTYTPAFFQLTGTVKIQSNFLADQVLAKVEQRLRAAFSFESRSFGQPVTISEVIAVIQSVPGVVAVDLNTLHRTDASPADLTQLGSLWTVVPASAPQSGRISPRAAELLLLDPRPLLIGVL